MRYFPAIASTAIVHCWVCNYSFRDRGSRFCSARCREHYDSGASAYDRHHAGKVFDVPLRSWKVVAGPPASMLGASYYTPLLGRSHCHQQHEAQAREAMRRDEPVVCCNPACGRTIRRRMRRQKYCSTRCRKADHPRAKIRGMRGDAKSRTTPLKRPNQFNDKAPAKSGPRIGLPWPARAAP
jgi:predicted nucleic acid-binding Zn ribbon protein